MSQLPLTRPKPVILVVDDDIGTVELIQMMLNMRGYEVVAAFSGQEAMAIIQEYAGRRRPWQPIPLDLILLDIMMPGIDGFKVCQFVKEDPVLQYIPVIMVTALEGLADKTAAVDFGADGYVTKPFMPDEIHSIIKAKLQIKRREEMLLRQNRELVALNAIAEAANSTLNPVHVLQASLSALIQVTDLSAAAVYLYDEAAGSLILIAQHHVCRPDTLSARQGIAAQVLRSQQVYIADESDESCDPSQEPVTDKSVPCMWVPLRGVEHSLGVLEVYRSEFFSFEARDREIFSTIGNRIGIALENAQIFHSTQMLLSRSAELGPLVP